jgi:hypothetical protein
MGELDDMLRPYLDDPEEGPMLRAILANPADRELRKAYAELLARRDDLRSALVTGQFPFGNARAMNQLAPMFGKAGFDAWFCVMKARRPIAPIRNCGAADSSWGKHRFSFECMRTWESLAPTDDPKVRSCDTCNQRVYFCDDDRELLAKAREGRCVAMREPEELWLANRAQRIVPATRTGRPQPADYIEDLVRYDE